MRTLESQSLNGVPRMGQEIEDGYTLCPHCGQSSRDPDFCDVCNREMSIAVAHDIPPSSVTCADGLVIDCAFWEGIWPERPDSAIPFASGIRRFRIHGFRPDIWKQLQAEVEERSRLKLDVLSPIEIVPAGDGAIVVAEASSDVADPSLDGHATSELSRAMQLAKKLGRVMTGLHEAGLVWLNFAPDAVECYAGKVRATNLDVGVFQVGECRDRVRISPLYSPPELCRFQAERIGPPTDVYQLALVVYYKLAGLSTGFAGAGLEAFGFEIPQLRVFAPDLFPGIWPVLAKALQPDPAARYQSVEKFLIDLEQAAERAEHRCTITGPTETVCRRPIGFLCRIGRLFPWFRERTTDSQIRAEIGSLTATGAAKAAKGQVNQDAVEVLRFQITTNSPRTIDAIIIADGVTTARVGRGEIASAIACRKIRENLEQALQQSSAEPDWREILDGACVAASEAIVAAALEEPEQPADVSDSDVMSTTALVAVLDGSTLHLANVGDSRAYLISPLDGTSISADRDIEQLTVDGDVGTALLSEGAPPEQVREMAAAAKALRFCLGACQQREDGTLACNPSRSLPRHFSVNLLPGECVVLCSDGLVEEGAFLEPKDVLEVSAGSVNRTAQELAEKLVEAANGRQRLPSVSEPGGFGDNITCVVLRWPKEAIEQAPIGSVIHG